MSQQQVSTSILMWIVNHGFGDLSIPLSWCMLWESSYLIHIFGTLMTSTLEWKLVLVGSFTHLLNILVHSLIHMVDFLLCAHVDVGRMCYDGYN